MKKKQAKVINYKKPFFITLIIAIVFGGCFVINIIFNLSSNGGRYEDLLPYLMQARIIEACKTKMDATGRAYNCRFKEYGISSNGDVFAKYSIYEVNEETGEKVGDVEIKTLYFKQDESSKKDNNGSWGVTEYQ